METYLYALILGVVEGLTEFLPVSSTGHLIVIGSLLGFQGPEGNVFEIVIQFGAILAICWLYRGRLLNLGAGVLARDAQAQRFTFGLGLAVLPAVIVGVLFHDVIKEVFFSPYTASIALIIGGIVLIVVERCLPTPRLLRFEDMPLRTIVLIGCFQVLAMIPGVSRAGATIVGGLLCGVERRTAAEFSFFLAIPTMLGATCYDLYMNWHHLHAGDATVIGIGFLAAFISALIVVRFMIGIVTHYGFAPFGWYRIAFGSAMLVWLLS